MSIRERYPAPWTVYEVNGGYRVESSNGRTIVHVYGDEGLRRSILDLPTRAEARALASAIAQLPELVETAKWVIR